MKITIDNKKEFIKKLIIIFGICRIISILGKHEKEITYLKKEVKGIKSKGE